MFSACMSAAKRPEAPVDLRLYVVTESGRMGRSYHALLTAAQVEEHRSRPGVTVEAVCP